MKSYFNIISDTGPSHKNKMTWKLLTFILWISKQRQTQRLTSIVILHVKRNVKDHNDPLSPFNNPLKAFLLTCFSLKGYLHQKTTFYHIIALDEIICFIWGKNVSFFTYLSFWWIHKLNIRSLLRRSIISQVASNIWSQRFGQILV